MNRIKDLREREGITIQELSSKTGIPKTSLNNYENEKRSPREPKTWRILAEFFNVPVGYIMGVSDIPHNDDAYNKKSKDEIFSDLKLSKPYDHFNKTLIAGFEVLSDALISNLNTDTDKEILANTINELAISYNFNLSAHGPNFANKFLRIIDIVATSSMARTNQLMASSELREDYLKKYLREKNELNSLLDDLFNADIELYEKDNLNSHRPFYSDKY